MSGQWDRSASSSWGRQGRGSGLDSWLGLATQMLVLPFQLPFQMLGWGMQAITGSGQGLLGLVPGGTGDCGCGGSRQAGLGYGGTTGDGYGGATGAGYGGATGPVYGGVTGSGSGETSAYGGFSGSGGASPFPPSPPPLSGTGSVASSAGAVSTFAETTNREEKDMACDQDLSGTDLKIIEYTIVSVDPDIENDWERVLQPTTTVATTQDMTENGFTAWVIALFFQRPSEDRRRAEERLGVEDENWKQYLRVCYCVQCRMPIPYPDCCQEQANALRDINRTLRRIGGLQGGGGGQVGQGGGGGALTPTGGRRRGGQSGESEGA